MTLIRYIIIWCWSILHSPLLLLDGSDNTVSINHTLYKMLQFLGIYDNNRIYTYHICNYQNGDTYAFEILQPEEDCIDPSIWSELKYNTHYHTFGFECRCPTIQTMYYHWNISPRSTVKAIVLPKYRGGKIQFYIWPLI